MTSRTSVTVPYRLNIKCPWAEENMISTYCLITSYITLINGFRSYEVQLWLFVKPTQESLFRDLRISAQTVLYSLHCQLFWGCQIKCWTSDMHICKFFCTRRLKYRCKLDYSYYLLRMTSQAKQLRVQYKYQVWENVHLKQTYVTLTSLKSEQGLLVVFKSRHAWSKSKIYHHDLKFQVESVKIVIWRKSFYKDTD